MKCLKLKWKATLTCIILFALSGCGSIAKLPGYPDSERIGFYKKGQPVEFDCTCITIGRHEYLERCEDIVEQEGLRP